MNLFCQVKCHGNMYAYLYIKRYILSCSSLLLGYFQITTVFYVQIRLNIEKNPIKKWKQDRNFFLLFFSLLFIPNQNGSIEKVKGIRIIPYFSRSSTSYFSGSSDSVILKFLLYLIEKSVTRHFGFDGAVLNATICLCCVSFCKKKCIKHLVLFWDNAAEFKLARQSP